MVFALIQLLALLVLTATGSAATGPGVGPLPKGEKEVWSHAPFEFGDCSICHQRNNRKDPGPLKMPVNELCYNCHDQIKEGLKARKFKHAPVQSRCVTCHNPHNAKVKKLLRYKPPLLCYQCHSDMKEIVTKSKVQHGAMTVGKSCLNCHNPHSSNVERLLVQLPFDLCMNCHAKDGLQDDQGKAMINFKTLLKNNPKWHGPVAAKDCSACHKPHGSENFRLLALEYPARFYSSFDPKNYALCFRCHNDKMVKEPRTTTLTNFRDGDRNLHFLHVNKPQRGRTCRACHDIHATKQDHQIRDGVPYGTSGWILPINYQKLPDGGQCVKTCHGARAYKNKTPAKSPDKGVVRREAGSSGSTRPAGGQSGVPQDFAYEEKSMGAVTFSHHFHVLQRGLSCTECHVKLFQMKKGVASADMSMATINKGQYCGNCHNGNRAFKALDFASCARCHKKK